MTTKETFDKAWLQSQPRPIRDAIAIQDPNAREAALASLGQDGYLIDVPLMSWLWDPFDTMTVRINNGFTWVPSGFGANIPVMPGLEFPGQPSYDPNNPPEDAIKVSVEPAHYLPADDLYVETKPFKYRAQASENAKDLDGVGSSWWPVTYPADDEYALGSIYRDGDAEYVKSELRTAFGAKNLWIRTQ